MMKPLFSIIVPIYKVEDYLDECVESILAQTYDNYELILVDDGSPDRCPALCDSWAEKDSRIKVVHKVNGGLSDARNAGMDAAAGEYLLMLDGDDYYNNNRALELLADKIEKNHSDIVMFGCTDWNMRTDEKIVSRGGYDIDFIENSDYNDVLHMLLSTKQLPGGSTIFAAKRSIIEAHHIRFKYGIQAEDHDYVLGVFINSQSISALDEPFYLYRQARPGSITGSASLKMIDGIAYTLDKWYPIVERLDSELLKKDFLNYLAFIYTTGFVVSGRLPKDKRKQAFSVMKKYRFILDYGYWKKTRFTKLGISIAGMNLFSLAAVWYFNRTHIIV